MERGGRFVRLMAFGGSTLALECAQGLGARFVPKDGGCAVDRDAVLSAEPIGLGDDGAELCEFGVGELERRGAHVLFEMLDGAGSREWAA